MNTGDLRLGANRDKVLAKVEELVSNVWAEFDQARESEPEISPQVESLLSKSLPTLGSDPLNTLLAAAGVLNQSTAQSRPRFFAYIGSSGLEMGAVADFLAASYDINMATDARAATMLEHQTSSWLAEFIDCPGFSGLFTSGGTVSNFTALAAARHRADPGAREHGISAPLAVYCSSEAHYSNQRAVELLGIGRTSMRSVAIDEQHRMNIAELRKAVEADIAAGIKPMAVIASAGTTLTGAVDDLNAIADICDEFNIWMHVDGAYGGPAAGALTSAPLFSGLNRADSITIDAHKWLFVPKACSILLVKDIETLASTFRHDEAYMPHDGEVPNPVDVTLEYSRPLRALKLWLGFQTHGSEAFSSAIEGNLELAQQTYEIAAASSEFRVLPHKPQLSIVPFQYLPEVVQSGKVSAASFNKALCNAIVQDGRVFLSPAEIDGETWLRPCFTNFRTTPEDVEELFTVVREVGAVLEEKYSNN